MIIQNPWAMRNKSKGHRPITEEMKVTVISHFAGENNAGVNASVHNVFWGRKNTSFLSSRNWKLPIIANKGQRDDVWIINGFTSLLKIPVLVAVWFAPKKTQIVFYLHETHYMLNWISSRNLFNRISSRFAKYLIAFRQALVWSASPIGAEVLQSFWHANSENIIFVGEAIKSFPTLKSGRKKKNSKLHVVGAGLANHRKGFDRFLSVAEKINREEPGRFSFTWYSKGNNPVPKNFRHFVSWAPYVEDFQKEVANYDIHIMCSRDDPFPLVSLEALSSGLTVIAFPNTGPYFLGPPILRANDVSECLRVLTDFSSNRNKLISRRVNQDLAKDYSVEKFLSRALVEYVTSPDYAKFVSLQINTTFRKCFDKLVRSPLLRFRVRRALTLVQKYMKSQNQSHANNKMSLVGRSPNLLGSQLGSKIDKSDVVIRVNHEASHLHASDIGLKTSVVYITPAYNAERLSSDIRVLRPGPFVSRRSTIKRLEAGPFGRGNVQDLLNWEISKSAQKVIQSLYPNYKSFWPTTGTAAVIVTLLEERNLGLPLDLYGMSLYSESDSKNLHKFDGSKTVFDGKHDFYLEQKFLNGLQNLGLVKVWEAKTEKSKRK